MTDSQDKAIERRIEETVVRALGISPSGAKAPLRMGSTPGWDSMGHMMVVMEIEKEFNTRFPPYLLPSLVDIPSIAKMIQNSNQNAKE